jgi:mRNA (guanine-N7-)-methyltransferase
VVVEKLMGLGKDFHFDDMDMHSEIDQPENQMTHNNGNKKRKLVKGEGATVSVGQGVCRLKFDTDTLEKVFRPPKTSEDMFGLQYTFTLVEGSDHAAGVGEAVDLPEWLTPIPALKELGEEAGLELEYATNFHKFYEERKDPSRYTAAHNALYNMKVLNRNGSISEQEWEVSRMYVAVKFRKVRESEIDIGDEDVGADEMKDVD